MPSPKPPRRRVSCLDDRERFRSGRRRYFAARKRAAEIYRLEVAWSRPAAPARYRPAR